MCDWKKMNLCFVLLMSFVCTLVCTMAQAANVTVQNLQISSSIDKSVHLVFSLSGETNHKIFTLSNPNRVVVDFDHAEPAAGLKQTTLVSGIQSLRVGKQKNVLRVVFEVSQPMQFKGTVDRKTHQLMLDLATSSSTIAATPDQAKATDALTEFAKNIVPTVIDNKPQKTITNNDSKSSQKSIKELPVIAGSQKKFRDIVIAIDAGHGGKDSGAIGSSGIQEKNVVLEIAKKLQKALQQEPGFDPRLTRSGDYFIELAQRRAIAKDQLNADLFISVHADSWENRQARGASVFILSRRGATSALAKYLADSENRSDYIGGVSLKDKDETLRNVLADLAMEGSLEHSVEAGNFVLDEVSKITSLHKSNIEQAGFVVLKSLHMPSMLVETGFISNDYESRRLNDDGYQAQLASAIAKGIKRYFEDQPPPGTYFALRQQQAPFDLKPANNKKPRSARENANVNIAEK